MVGDEAAALRHGLEVTYPVDNGVIRNWDDMELLWNYTFRWAVHASDTAQGTVPSPCAHIWSYLCASLASTLGDLPSSCCCFLPLLSPRHVPFQFQEVEREPQ